MAQSANQDQSAALRQISIDAPRYSYYKPLDTTRREIRVLDIDAGLQCRLRTVSLDDKLAYSAISYYWGSPSATVAIVVNGETLKLRKTVHKALTTLYELCGPITVWLDVLCINQRDFAEQSAQVAMMGDIYTQTRRVYAWLGQGEPDPQYALSYVNSDDDARGGYDKHFVLAGVQQLCSSPYFTRVWTIQECLLNANVFMMSGAQATDFDSMIRAFEPLINCIQTKFESTEATRAWDKVSAMRDVREALIQTERKPLLELVLIFADRQCQDLRDKFYGFRALSRDGHCLQVDYRDELLEILFRVISNRNWDCFITSIQGSASAEGHARGPVRRLCWDPWHSYHFRPGNSRYQPFHASGNGFGYYDLRGYYSDLWGEFDRVYGSLRIPQDENALGLQDLASDWIVHRIELLEDPEADDELERSLKPKSVSVSIQDLKREYDAYLSVMMWLVPNFDS